jgi:hypothetical protein
LGRSIRTGIDEMIQLLPAFILLIYPLSFLKSGESMPVVQEVSLIDADKYCRLVIILTAEAIAIGEVHQNWN